MTKKFYTNIETDKKQKGGNVAVKKNKTYKTRVYVRMLWYVETTSFRAHLPSNSLTRKPVSYTHLDVYKRQGLGPTTKN